MKFIVERAVLIPALERAVRAAATKSTLQALALVHLDARDSHLRVAATSLEISISTVLGAVVLEPGFWAVDAKGLLERVKNMPETALTFAIQTKPSTSLRITAPRTTRAYTMHALPGEELPAIPAPGKKVRATYGAVELGKLLRQCVPAMADDGDQRAHLKCMWIDLAERPCVYATDGHRLHRAGPPNPNEEALHVPRGAALQLARMCDEVGDAGIEIGISATNLHFTSGGVTLGAKRAEADRVPFEQVIPKDQRNTTVQVDRAALLAAVKSVLVVSEFIQVEVLRERNASAQMCELHGEAFSGHVALMCQNLALSVLKDRTVTIGFDGALDPAKITAPEFTAVLMTTR